MDNSLYSHFIAGTTAGNTYYSIARTTAGNTYYSIARNTAGNTYYSIVDITDNGKLLYKQTRIVTI